MGEWVNAFADSRLSITCLARFCHSTFWIVGLPDTARVLQAVEFFARLRDFSTGESEAAKRQPEAEDKTAIETATRRGKGKKLDQKLKKTGGRLAQNGKSFEGSCVSVFYYLTPWGRMS